MTRDEREQKFLAALRAGKIRPGISFWGKYEPNPPPHPPKVHPPTTFPKRAHISKESAP